MTKVEECEEQLCKEKILLVSNQSLPGSIKAMAYCDNDCKAIFLDNSKIIDSREMHVILEHELIHLENKDTLYSLNESLDSKRRKEYKVNLLTIKRLIPMVELFNQVYIKHLSESDLIEFYDITIDMLHFAFSTYSQTNWWIESLDKLRNNYDC